MFKSFFAATRCIAIQIT